MSGFRRQLPEPPQFAGGFACEGDRRHVCDIDLAFPQGSDHAFNEGMCLPGAGASKTDETGVQVLADPFPGARIGEPP